MFDLMKELLKEGIIKSCVLIIFIDRNNDLINQIIKMPEHKYFNFKEKVKNNNEYSNNNNDTNPLLNTTILSDDNKIEVYHSDSSGVGKSRTIIDLLKKNNNYNYCYFPIGG